jgi:phosphoglycolate phosphatase
MNDVAPGSRNGNNTGQGRLARKNQVAPVAASRPANNQCFKMKTGMRRLILFDIDGTLLNTNGAARRAFERALVEVYGTAGPLATHPFDGKTDPQIARELLKLAGLNDAAIDSRVTALWDVYLRELAIEMAEPDHTTTLYPGVPALLAALQQNGDVCLALLTGNIARGARLKLESAGISEFFPFGAFGSDCEQRDGLPAVAVERARQHTGRGFQGHEVVIIGDTPNDVTCGHALGVFTLAVATGRHSRADLLAAGAHMALADLGDTALLVDMLVA